MIAWVDTDYACFGLIAKKGVVVEAAPIARWALGKNLAVVCNYYKTQKRARVRLVRTKMIAPSAIENYFKRVLRDSAIYKRWSLKKAQRRLAKKAGKDYKYVLPPRRHQAISMYLGHKYDRWLYLLDMGAGKSFCILHLMNQRRKAFKRALVVVPAVANIGAWLDEVQKHTPNLKASGITGTKEARTIKFEGKSDLTVITYMGLLSFVCVKVQVGYRVVKGKRRPKYAMKVDPKKIAYLCKHYDFLCLDEITEIKNHLSTTFKACRAMSSKMKLVYGLTGTPFGRDATDLWAQFFVVDGGESLGPTLGLFREAFFSQKQKFFGGYEYKLKKKLRPELMRMMRNRSIRFAEAEYRHDMPPKNYITLKVRFSEKAEKLYDHLAEKLHKDRKNHVLAERSFIRMRQLCSGFAVMTSTVDKEEERVEVPLKENPKLDLLVQQLKELPSDAKAVVFNQFKLSGRLIEERLKKEGITARRLYGGTKDKIGLVKEFTQTPSVKVLICSSSGALGLNLQVANYVFFYESPVDVIERMQMEKRCDRPGQTKTIFNYDIVVADSVDERILNFHGEGKALLATILDGKTPKVDTSASAFMKQVAAGKIDLRRKKRAA